MIFIVVKQTKQTTNVLLCSLIKTYLALTLNVNNTQVDTVTKYIIVVTIYIVTILTLSPSPCIWIIVGLKRVDTLCWLCQNEFRAIISRYLYLLFIYLFALVYFVLYWIYSSRHPLFNINRIGYCMIIALNL